MISYSAASDSRTRSSSCSAPVAMACTGVVAIRSRPQEGQNFDLPVISLPQREQNMRASYRCAFGVKRNRGRIASGVCRAAADGRSTRHRPARPHAVRQLRGKRPAMARSPPPAANRVGTLAAALRPVPLDIILESPWSRITRLPSASRSSGRLSAALPGRSRPSTMASWYTPGASTSAPPWGSSPCTVRAWPSTSGC